MTKGERQPRERHETVRQSIADALRDNALTARELSVLLSIRERDVAPHLEHLERSLASGGERLHVEPARCSACDFVFRDRRRASRPSRCPRCKSERIVAPVFSVRAR